MKNCLPFFLILAPFFVPGLSAQQPSPDAPLTADTAIMPATSAVGHLAVSGFNRGNITDPIQLAQGKIAGLSITRPGSDPNGRFVTRVRGLSSRTSNTEPLIVLNGVPGASLYLIDPDDVVSFTVLKDASATAMYGMRGASGVILVETRKDRPDRLYVEYDAQLAIDKNTDQYKVFNAAEFIQAGGQDLSPNTNTDTDWQDAVLRSGISQAHHLRFSAPVGQGAVQAALHYRNANGIVRETGLQQFSGQLSLRQSLWKNRLHLSGGLMAAQRQADYGFPEAFHYAATFNPSAPVTTTDPQWASFGGYVQPQLFDYFNPVAMIEQNANRGQTDRWLGRLEASLELFRGFTLATQVAQEHSHTFNGEYYDPKSNYRGNNQQGSIRRFDGKQNSRFWETRGEYKLHIGAHTTLQLTGGYAWQQFDYEATDTTATGVFGLDKTSSLSEYEPLLLAPAYTQGGFSKGKNTLAAFFGRLQVNFRERYFIEAGLRREGSNRLGRNKRWGSFPFVSAGADFSKIFALKKLDRLTLRTGYGIAGQQPAADGLSRQVLSPSYNVYYNGEFIPGYSPSTNENPDLKWEQKREFNIGLDAALPGNKLTASVDFFSNTSADLIYGLQVPQPPNIAAVTYANVIELSGKGLEASFRWNTILKSEKTDWSAGIVFSRYTIEVAKNGIDAPYMVGYPGAPGMCCAQYVLIRDGDPLGQLWGPVRKGLDNTGMPIYEDINRDGTVSATSLDAFDQDQTLIGSGLPKFELGFQNDLRWRNFDLNIFFRGTFGHDLMHENRLFYENPASAMFTPYNRIQTIYFDPRYAGSNRVENTYVEKASFLRLDNLTLGYAFRIPEEKWLKKARVYVGGQNLFTITSYTGLDPEARLADPGNTDNGARYNAPPEPFLTGIDRRPTYPFARTFLLGAQVEF